MRSYYFVFAIVLSLASGVSAQSITREQADEILKELKAIRQAIEGLQRPAQPQAGPAAPSDERARLPKPAVEYAIGRSDAPLTIVEFTDLQCPFCSRFATNTFDELKKAYIDTGKVRFVTRDFPLTSLHPLAQRAAVASRCAGEQQKFWEMRTYLVRNAAKLTPEFILAAADEVKIGRPAFEKCLDSGRFDALIQKDIVDATSAGISGTPTFVIGRTSAGPLDGWKLVGAQPLDMFDRRIQQVTAEPAPAAK
jgi:protein-disulfide isomerase